MALGRKTGGRRKGSLNKKTHSVKEALEAAFHGLGGKAALVRWAETNPTEFYRIWAKLLPRDINATIDGQMRLGGNVTIYLPENGREGTADDATANQ